MKAYEELSEMTHAELLIERKSAITQIKELMEYKRELAYWLRDKRPDPPPKPKTKLQEDYHAMKKENAKIRKLLALALKENGGTYKHVAKEMGISLGRAKVLVYGAVGVLKSSEALDNINSVLDMGAEEYLRQCNSTTNWQKG